MLTSAVPRLQRPHAADPVNNGGHTCSTGQFCEIFQFDEIEVFH